MAPKPTFRSRVTALLGSASRGVDPSARRREPAPLDDGAVAWARAGERDTSILIGAINPRVDVSLNRQFGYDWKVFGYAAAVATLCGLVLVLGLVPAMRASRVRLTSVLHDGGYGG